MRPFRLITAIILATFILSLAGGSSAQVQGLLSLDRLSLLDTWKTGGRPLGMGMAYTAVSDDAFSLIYNPAGLVQIEDRELSIGIHHNQMNIDNRYESFRYSGDNSSTSFGHIAYINPMNTYGGNIVFGLGMFRSNSSDIEYVRNALRPDLEGAIENSLLQSGTVYQYR
ncbi:MAG TPA: UPF0164 family protein, partial [Candidatus Krumholzibacterium sp.]|nr:UPF0164 family protein [Candidatus Krumholzibacterium sp.]